MWGDLSVCHHPGTLLQGHTEESATAPLAHRSVLPSTKSRNTRHDPAPADTPRRPVQLASPDQRTRPAAPARWVRGSPPPASCHPPVPPAAAPTRALRTPLLHTLPGLQHPKCRFSPHNPRSQAGGTRAPSSSSPGDASGPRHPGCPGRCSPTPQSQTAASDPSRDGG